MTTTGPVLKEDAALAQGHFDYTIGRLDRVLSLLVLWAKGDQLDEPNKQTLKHHAEDMIAAGQCILSKLGLVEATPQPSYNPFADEKGKQHQSPG